MTDDEKGGRMHNARNKGMEFPIIPMLIVLLSLLGFLVLFLLEVVV